MASVAENEMTKRLNIYLDDETANQLQVWAENQGHSMSSLAAFLIDRAVESAASQDDWPLSNPATIHQKVINKEGDRP